MRIVKLGTNGRVTIPAEVRRRWGTSRVLIEDAGDRLVVRPMPDDPVAALRGSLKRELRVPTEELRRRARADEEAAEQAKWGR